MQLTFIDWKSQHIWSRSNQQQVGQSRQNVGNNIAVIVFIIGSLQNQLRDRIDESANVTNLERAKSTMRKSRQKVGGTKTEALGHIPREFQQLNRSQCLRKKPRAQNKNVEYSCSSQTFQQSCLKVFKSILSMLHLQEKGWNVCFALYWSISHI